MHVEVYVGIGTSIEMIKQTKTSRASALAAAPLLITKKSSRASGDLNDGG